MNKNNYEIREEEVEIGSDCWNTYTENGKNEFPKTSKIIRNGKQVGIINWTVK